MCAVLAAACSDDPPADVAGDYTVNVVNGPNPCMFANWTEGNTAQNISVLVTQTGGDANITFNGLAGTYLTVILGSNQYPSDVSGNHVHGEIIGSVTGKQNNCSYQLTSELTASLANDTLTGTLTYKPTTNHHADCMQLETCTNTQSFNGLRPPK